MLMSYVCSWLFSSLYITIIWLTQQEITRLKEYTKASVIYELKMFGAFPIWKFFRSAANDGSLWVGYAAMHPRF